MVNERTKKRRLARIARHEAKSKGNYVFPSPMAKLMEKVNLRTQYEASMLSVSFIICGLTVSAIYMMIYANLILWYKIVLVINLLAGMVFLSSSLITTFQQYKSYLEVMKFQKSQKGGGEEDGIPKKKTKGSDRRRSGRGNLGSRGNDSGDR